MEWGTKNLTDYITTFANLLILFSVSFLDIFMNWNPHPNYPLN